VLTLGVLEMGGHYFGRQPTPTTVAAPLGETKAAAATQWAPPSREPEALPGSLAGLADPHMTAAIPSKAVWQPGLGVSAQRPAHSAAWVRAADVADAKSGARLDEPKFDLKDSPETTPAQGTERIPNMASLVIPANAAPTSLRQAAMAGDPAAVYELAARAAEGRDMARDPILAARLFEHAATHGMVPAQFRIGKLYEKGLGVPRDLGKAKGWYQSAADMGNALAMHQLAVLIAEGVNGKPDYAAAIAWFQRAAQHGVRDSQFNLAVLLARGLGTAPDLAGSYTWFSIVAAQGDEDAARKRDEVGSRLSPAKLVAAKLAAERWRPETPDRSANEVAQPAQGWDEAPPRRTASAGRV
jgi:localization factor PodJL